MTLDRDFVASYALREAAGDHPLLDSFNGLGLVVYRRTYSRPLYDEQGEYLRHEEWHETIERAVNGANDIGAGLTEEESERLFDLMWNRKALVGGRMLWQLGTGNTDRIGSASLVNCYYTSLSTVDDFRFLFEMLMLGGGVGFNVTEASVAILPAVQEGSAKKVDGFDADFIVPDNRQGWGELLVRTLNSGFEGTHFTYSTDAVRPEGAPIKTFGGTASGPGILVEGVENINEILGIAEGRKLSTVEVLDIANIIGSIVVSGNVRRSAQIALGDATDEAFLSAKRWDLGDIPSYRAMSNNTVVITDIDQLGSTFWDGYTKDEDGKAKGEAYGLFNPDYARSHGRIGEKHHDPSIEGVNPCGEIPLAHRESCNLTELVLPRLDSFEEAEEAVRLLYKVQKVIATLPHPDPMTDAITSENMRLGMGVTGVAQASPEARGWLAPLYEGLRHFDSVWSEGRGLPESVRLTTVKPSGTLSLIAGVTPGVHPGYSRFHIRRMRVSTSDPIFQWTKDRGLPWEFVLDFDGNEDPRTAVVEFPCEFPETTKTNDVTSAVDQMREARFMSEVWADNAVSVTVTFKPEELKAIKKELRKTWSTTKSISFLPYSDHGFVQAPLEPISKAEYTRRLDAIDLRVEAIHAGHSDLGDDECEGGACPIR